MMTATKRAQYGVNSGWWLLADIIGADEPREFNANTATLRGRYTSGGITFDQLPSEYHHAARQSEYVVYSYDTPIAWRTNGQWFAPSVKYSVTTSKQQGRVIAAASQTSAGVVHLPEVI